MGDALVSLARALTEVGQPRVGAFDGASHSQWLGAVRGPGMAARGDDEIVEADPGGEAPGDAVVAAAMEVQGLDVLEESLNRSWSPGT